MATDTKQILVVLPTLGDRLDTLQETLETIEEQRMSSSLRLIVVAPASANAARELALKYGAEVVDDPKTGISEAINCGIRVRNGEEFYAWMGDDDLFRPQGLRKLQNLLDKNPSAVVAYGGCDYIDPSGKFSRRAPPGS